MGNIQLNSAIHYMEALRRQGNRARSRRERARKRRDWVERAMSQGKPIQEETWFRNHWRGFDVEFEPVKAKLYELPDGTRVECVPRDLRFTVTVYHPDGRTEKI